LGVVLADAQGAERAAQVAAQPCDFALKQASLVGSEIRTVSRKRCFRIGVAEDLLDLTEQLIGMPRTGEQPAPLGFVERRLHLG